MHLEFLFILSVSICINSMYVWLYLPVHMYESQQDAYWLFVIASPEQKQLREYAYRAIASVLPQHLHSVSTCTVLGLVGEPYVQKLPPSGCSLHKSFSFWSYWPLPFFLCPLLPLHTPNAGSYSMIWRPPMGHCWLVCSLGPPISCCSWPFKVH